MANDTNGPDDTTPSTPEPRTAVPTGTAEPRTAAPRTGVFTRLYTGSGAFDIVGHRKWWYLATSLLVLVCLGSIIFKGFEFGIDFEGGTRVQMPVASANGPITTEQATEVYVDTLGKEPASVQIAGAGDLHGGGLLTQRVDVDFGGLLGGDGSVRRGHRHLHPRAALEVDAELEALEDDRPEADQHEQGRREVPPLAVADDVERTAAGVQPGEHAGPWRGGPWLGGAGGHGGPWLGGARRGVVGAVGVVGHRSGLLHCRRGPARAGGALPIRHPHHGAEPRETRPGQGLALRGEHHQRVRHQEHDDEVEHGRHAEGEREALHL